MSVPSPCDLGNVSSPIHPESRFRSLKMSVRETQKEFGSNVGSGDRKRIRRAIGEEGRSSREWVAPLLLGAGTAPIVWDMTSRRSAAIDHFIDGQSALLEHELQMLRALESISAATAFMAALFGAHPVLQHVLEPVPGAKNYVFELEDLQIAFGRGVDVEGIPHFYVLDRCPVCGCLVAHDSGFPVPAGVSFALQAPLGKHMVAEAKDDWLPLLLTLTHWRKRPSFDGDPCSAAQ